MPYGYSYSRRGESNVYSKVGQNKISEIHEVNEMPKVGVSNDNEKDMCP